LYGRVRTHLVMLPDQEETRPEIGFVPWRTHLLLLPAARIADSMVGAVGKYP